MEEMMLSNATQSQMKRAGLVSATMIAATLDSDSPEPDLGNPVILSIHLNLRPRIKTYHPE